MRVDEFLAYLRPFYPTWDRELEKELVKKFELPLRQQAATSVAGHANES